MRDKNSTARELFKDNLNHYLQERGIEQVQIVDALGTTASTVSDWVNGKKYPRVDAMQRLADFLGVRMSDLTGDRSSTQRSPFSYKNILPVERFTVPMLGSVAAGEPIYDEADFDTRIPAGHALKCDFALTVKGDSMEPGIKDGDVILVRDQQNILDGRVAVVAIGDEVTLKHVYRTRNGVTLVSDNPKYPPMAFVDDECDEIRIMGKPVAYLRGM